MDLDFVSYGTRANIKERSGAYLFLPDREASSIVTSQGKPKISLVAGPLVSRFTLLIATNVCLFVCCLFWGVKL